MEQARSLPWSKTLFPNVGVSPQPQGLSLPPSKQPICPNLPAFTSSPLDNTTRVPTVDNILQENNDLNPT